MTCPDCKGTGKIELLTSSVPCERCAGKSMDDLLKDAAAAHVISAMFPPLPTVGWDSVVQISSGQPAAFVVHSNRECDPELRAKFFAALDSIKEKSP